MAHHATEELKPFKLGPNHKRSIMMLLVIGVGLFLAGLGLSQWTMPYEQHEEAAPAAAPAGDHGNEHGSAAHGDAAHEAAPAAHAEGHGHMDDLARYDDTTAAGTWKRAHWYEEQGSGHHADEAPGLGAKVGVALMIGAYWWLAVALFGVFFIAVSYTANAGWYVPFKRVLENYFRFIPIGAVIMLAVFFLLGDKIYEWRIPGIAEHDELIDHKSAFLSVSFIVATGVFLVAIWYVMGRILKASSLKEDSEGGLAQYKRSKVFSVLFLPLFGFGFPLFTFLWIMSVDPHWFSTIFGVYCFAGLFVSGMTVTMFITTGLKREGFLPSFSADQLHDIGKFMFAFSVFWAYIWVSQYLLIWYANIPEETIYYYNRFQDHKLLFTINVLINFLFPFIALMTREAKRKAESLRFAGSVMLFGRFIDAYLLFVPGALGAASGFHVMLMAAGALCAFGGVFLLIVYKGLEGAPTEPRKHPFYEESLHHSTGV